MSRRGGRRSMWHRIRCLTASKPDCSARDGVARRGGDVVEREHFHQPQNLHELALALLAHPGFQKTPECHELFRQPPAGRRLRA